MSEISQGQRVGLKKILRSMTVEDLMSLSDTVTNKLIVVESVTEAIETILSFSKNAEELLKRRKVQRDLIFRYLAEEGVAMPSNTEKLLLIQRTLALWSSNKVRHNLANQSLQRHSAASTSNDDIKAFDPLALGQQFCQWYFELINSQNPSLGKQPQQWGPQHFWPDAKLNIASRTDTSQTAELLGAEMVSLRLLALTREERLFFSPNLDPHGLKTQMSPHGLVLVSVAGTIHRDSACLGIFEQIFGLICSPLEKNSWKIKLINLKIKGENALPGTAVMAPALNYSSSELQRLSDS